MGTQDDDNKKRKQQVDEMVDDHESGLLRHLGKSGEAFVERLRDVSERLGRLIGASKKND